MVASKAVVASVWVAVVVASVAAVVVVVASVWARVVVALVAVVLVVSVLVVSVLFVLVLFVVLLGASTMKSPWLAPSSAAAQALAGWLCRRAPCQRVAPSPRAVASASQPLFSFSRSFMFKHVFHK